MKLEYMYVYVYVYEHISVLNKLFTVQTLNKCITVLISWANI